MVKVGVLLMFGLNIALISSFRISVDLDASVEELNDALNQIELEEPLDTSSMLYVNPGITKGQCTCTGSQCGCCVLLKILLLTGPVCANLSYVADGQVFVTTVTFKNSVLFQAKFSLKDPKPVCFPVPFLTDSEICVTLYNVDLRDNQIGGCLKFNVKYKIFQQDLDLGCFRFPIPHNGQERLVGFYEFSKEEAEVDQEAGRKQRNSSRIFRLK